MNYEGYGIRHMDRIMAHFGYADKDEFFKKYSEDADFHKMVGFMENYFEEERFYDKLHRKIRDLEKQSSCCCSCCCCSK